jgi:hypothetical protein
MTNVHFLIHRFATDIQELDENSIASLVASEAAFLAFLCNSETLEGALVIDEVSICDDLSSVTQRLCFEAVAALTKPGAEYSYSYFTSNAQLRLVASSDGSTIALSGDYLPALEISRETLLPALYACGMRYLAFLEEVGHRGRRWSTTDLVHLRPFADRAGAAIALHGLATNVA